MDSSDDLADLAALEQKLSGRLAGIRREKAALKKARVENGTDVRLVNDHALIRYLERQKGLDVEAIRAEMRQIADESALAQAEKWYGRGLQNSERIPTVENP